MFVLWWFYYFVSLLDYLEIYFFVLHAWNNNIGNKLLTLYFYNVFEFTVYNGVLEQKIKSSRL